MYADPKLEAVRAPKPEPTPRLIREQKPRCARMDASGKDHGPVEQCAQVRAGDPIESALACWEPGCPWMCCSLVRSYRSARSWPSPCVRNVWHSRHRLTRFQTPPRVGEVQCELNLGRVVDAQEDVVDEWADDVYGEARLDDA